MLRSTLALLLLCLASAATAQLSDPQAQLREKLRAETDVKTLQGVATVAYREGDYELMAIAADRLAELRPHVPHYRFLAARAYVKDGERRHAFDRLVRLMYDGLYFPLEGDPDFAPLRNTQLYTHLVENFARQKQPYGMVRNMFEIPAGVVADSLAWDAQQEAWLYASLIDGRIYRRSKDGDVNVFAAPSASNGLDSVTSLAIDDKRRVLWAANLSGRPLRASLIQFDLTSGEVVSRHAVAQPGVRLMDIEVTPDGAVYATDASNPAIWTVTAEAAAAKRGEPALVFMQSPELTGLRGLAVDSSGQYLFFSDYELGLYGVNIARRQIMPISLGEKLPLGAIDELEWMDDSLVLVQNIGPQRVLRLRIGSSAEGGLHSQMMAQSLPEFDYPTTATVVGNELVIIGASHRNTVDLKTGKSRDGEALPPQQVVAANLTHGWQPPKGSKPGSAPAEDAQN